MQHRPKFPHRFYGNLLEGVEQMLELPEGDETLFRHFQLWVYTKHILEDSEDFGMMGWGPLIDLCIFRDKFGIAGLEDASIEQAGSFRKDNRWQIIPKDTGTHR